MLNYRIIHPRGDRTKICVAQVLDFEVDDWVLATDENFYYDKDAAHARCAELADEEGFYVVNIDD